MRTVTLALSSVPPPRGRLRRPAPRRRQRPRACAPPSSRRRPRARSRGRRPRAASRRAWPRPRRCVLSTPSPLHGRGDRPVHAHGRGPGLPRAHDGRPADRRARAVPGARLRRARRDLSLGPRQPARTRGRRWPTGRTAHDVRLPAGETGPRHDNAVAESFLGTFKNETCHPRSFATRKEARLASAGYVEGCHDRRRPHPAIDYHIPERRWTHSSSAWTRWSRERRRCHWRHDYGPLAVRGG